MVRRWHRTIFGSWVLEYTVSRLAVDLTARGHPVTPKGIYEWMAGRSAPKISRARAITELSGGRVTIQAIYRHYADRVADAPTARPPAGPVDSGAPQAR